jgi:predicted ATPase
MHDVDLELRPLTVLIGANGSGKTSLLDVLSLLAASANGRLESEISKLGGIDALLTFDRSSELSVEVLASEGKSTKRGYQLVVDKLGLGHHIKLERLKRAAKAVPSAAEKDGLGQAKFRTASGETLLREWARVDKDARAIHEHLAGTVHYHALRVDDRAPVRQAQPVHPARLPGRDGEDLIACLYSIRETDRERYETIEATLRTAFPGFERLDFPPLAAGMLGMTWKDDRFSRPFYMNQLSEGQLRFLWLTTLLESAGLGAITLIDEPEVSLHPELLSVLAALFRNAASRTQLIVATHADRLVRFLQPNEIVAMDMNDEGMVEATWADTLDIEEWLKEYTLDEVWRMGRLGGRA